MKKKAAHKKATAKKTVKRTAPRSTGNQTILFRRIVIISACLVLVVIGVVGTNRSSVNQAVAGASIARGLYSQGTASCQPIPSAKSYNVYFSAVGEKTFTNAARKITTNITNIPIYYLKKGVTYQYYCLAVDALGKEYSGIDKNGSEIPSSASKIKTLSNIKSM